MTSAEIIIGGDVCPTDQNRVHFENGNSRTLLNDLLPLFESVDLRIVNLECPLIEKPSPILKCGPVLGASSQCINGLIACGIDILCLANNHILDHGQQGFWNTIEACKRAGIEVVGAGRNLQEARRMLIRSVNGLRLGIIAVAENEFSIASDDRSGAAPLDAIDFVRQMRSERTHVDHVIVIIHGGNEHYAYPRPQLMNLCRFMIEEGASVVICQHTHCAGCYEEYEGGIIVYGQGNFLFDAHSKHRSWWEGFLVHLHLGSNSKPSMDVIPYTQSDVHIGAKRMKPDEGIQFLDMLKKRSSDIKEKNCVLEKWIDYCDTQRNRYYSMLCGFNRILGKLNTTGILTKAFVSLADLPEVIDSIRCESHREALLNILDTDLRRKQ